MHEFCISKDMKKNINDTKRKVVAAGKVVVHLCLTLIIKELKISVEQDKVVTNTKYHIYSVVRISTSYAQ